jgi:hypothetical protein
LTHSIEFVRERLQSGHMTPEDERTLRELLFAFQNEAAFIPLVAESLRVEALAALARREPDLTPAGFELLCSQLSPRHAPLARLRAAEVLAMARPPAAGLRHFIDAADLDPSLSPNLVLRAARRAGLDAEMAVRLLPYLERSVQRGYPLDEEEAGWVIQAAPATTRDQAESLQRVVRDQAREQGALLERYQLLLTGGNPARGRGLFFDKAGCYTCHQVGDQGRAGLAFRHADHGVRER